MFDIYQFILKSKNLYKKEKKTCPLKTPGLGGGGGGRVTGPHKPIYRVNSSFTST